MGMRIRVFVPERSPKFVVQLTQRCKAEYIRAVERSPKDGADGEADFTALHSPAVASAVR